MRLPFTILRRPRNPYRSLKEDYWMSDKPLVQQALAAELADILLKIPDPLPPSSFSRDFGVPSSTNGMASIDSGTDSYSPRSQHHSDTRAQNGQVLYACSAFHQRLIHSLDKQRLVPIALYRTQFNPPFRGRSVMVSRTVPLDPLHVSSLTDPLFYLHRALQSLGP